jgi:XRE family transcriptional regulator, regulator of sulfur utilization
MESIYVRLGQRIRSERLRQGLTQELVAEKARLSTAFIGQIERGQNTASLISLEKIARALGVPLADLLRQPSAAHYKAPLPSHRKIFSLLRERPAKEQEYILATVKTLVRRLNNVPGKTRKR